MLNSLSEYSTNISLTPVQFSSVPRFSNSRHRVTLTTLTSEQSLSIIPQFTLGQSVVGIVESKIDFQDHEISSCQSEEPNDSFPGSTSESKGRSWIWRLPYSLRPLEKKTKINHQLKKRINPSSILKRVDISCFSLSYPFPKLVDDPGWKFLFEAFITPGLGCLAFSSLILWGLSQQKLQVSSSESALAATQSSNSENSASKVKTTANSESKWTEKSKLANPNINTREPLFLPKEKPSVLSPPTFLPEVIDVVSGDAIKETIDLPSDSDSVAKIEPESEGNESTVSTTTSHPIQTIPGRDTYFVSQQYPPSPVQDNAHNIENFSDVALLTPSQELPNSQNLDSDESEIIPRSSESVSLEQNEEIGTTSLSHLDSSDNQSFDINDQQRIQNLISQNSPRADEANIINRIPRNGSNSEYIHKEIVLGTYAQGRVIVPMVWLEEPAQEIVTEQEFLTSEGLITQSDTRLEQTDGITIGRFAVELVEDVPAVDGTLALPAGTILITEIQSVSRESNVVQQYVVALIYKDRLGRTVQAEIPSTDQNQRQHILVRGIDNTPLIAEAISDKGGVIASQDILVGLLSGAARVGEIVNQPVEEVIREEDDFGESRTTTRTTRDDPDLLAAAIEGIFGVTADRLEERSDQLIQEILQRPDVLIVPEDTPVSVFFNSFVQVAR